MTFNPNNTTDLTALKDEIENDPLALAYKNSATSGDWKGDQVIADIINNADGTNDRTVTKDHVPVSDLRSIILRDWYTGLLTDEQAWADFMLTGVGGQQSEGLPVTADILQALAGIPTSTGSIWSTTNRIAANAAMAAFLQDVGASRADELFGYGSFVSASAVGQAFNLI